MHQLNLKFLIATLMCLGLVGCGPGVKTFDIKTSNINLTVTEPPSPRELVMSSLNVNVITVENFKELEQQLKADPKSVFLVLSPTDYEVLVSNIAEMRRYMAQQAAIVAYYRNMLKSQTNEQ